MGGLRVHRRLIQLRTGELLWAVSEWGTAAGAALTLGKEEGGDG